MSIFSSLTIIAFAALLHASFQLSVSVLTLMSGHAIGAKYSQARTRRLTISFIFGSAIATLLLLTFFSFVLLNLSSVYNFHFAWIISCSLVIGTGVAVWLFYYRRESGTMLWIPRGMAEYLNNRSKATKSSAEAFSLGLSSVFGELLIIIALIIISSLVLVQLPSMWQFVGLGIYTILSLASLLTVWKLIGSGHKLSQIQKWREKNKSFLQFVAGGGLIILGFFVYVNTISSGGF